LAGWIAFTSNPIQPSRAQWIDYMTDVNYTGLDEFTNNDFALTDAIDDLDIYLPDEFFAIETQELIVIEFAKALDE
jgi:hypothetical protein